MFWVCVGLQVLAAMVFAIGFARVVWGEKKKERATNRWEKMHSKLKTAKKEDEREHFIEKVEKPIIENLRHTARELAEGHDGDTLPLVAKWTRDYFGDMMGDPCLKLTQMDDAKYNLIFETTRKFAGVLIFALKKEHKVYALGRMYGDMLREWKPEKKHPLAWHHPILAAFVATAIEQLDEEGVREFVYRNSNIQADEEGYYKALLSALTMVLFTYWLVDSGNNHGESLRKRVNDNELLGLVKTLYGFASQNVPDIAVTLQKATSVFCERVVRVQEENLRDVLERVAKAQVMPHEEAEITGMPLHEIVMDYLL